MGETGSTHDERALAVQILTTEHFALQSARADWGAVDYSIETGTEVLRRTPEVLRSLLSGLSESWIEGTEGPGTWSSWQVVGHLTHIEEVDWMDRTRKILEHGTGRPFDPVDREAGFTRFAGWGLGELLDRFAEVRAENLQTLPSLVRIEDWTAQACTRHWAR